MERRSYGAVQTAHAAFWLTILGVGALLYRSFLVLPSFRLFAGILISLVLEALPYLTLGALVAATIHELVPTGWVARRLSRAGIAGIPIAALAGAVAPVCECAIVPTVHRLMQKGVPVSYAMTMLVAIPLLNPVVLLSTVAAFPGAPHLVLARFAGGYVVAIAVGFAFHATGGGRHSAWQLSHDSGSDSHNVVACHGGATADPRVRIDGIVQHAVGEFVSISGYFIAGATLSSLVQATVPVDLFVRAGASQLVAIAVMILLAYLLSVCSEADAFIGKAFLPFFGPAGVTAFLIFGPMLDLKNTAMLSGVLSRRAIVLLATILTVSVTLVAIATGMLV